jgi:hypothetical protein
VVQVERSCIKHVLFIKTKQQFRFSVSLLTEIKLKEKEGMHKTSSRAILSVN